MYTTWRKVDESAWREDPWIDEGAGREDPWIDDGAGRKEIHG